MNSLLASMILRVSATSGVPPSFPTSSSPLTHLDVAAERAAGAVITAGGAGRRGQVREGSHGCGRRLEFETIGIQSRQRRTFLLPEGGCCGPKRPERARGVLSSGVACWHGAHGGLPVEPAVAYVPRALRVLRVPDSCCGSCTFRRTRSRRDPYLYGALARLCGSIEAGGEALKQQSLFVTAVAAIALHAEREAAAAESRNSKLAVDRAKAHLKERFNEAASTSCMRSPRRPGFRRTRIRCISAWSALEGCCREAYRRRAPQRASASPTRAISRAASSASCA